MKKSIYEIILNSFAPDDCYFCQKLGEPICEKCLESRCNFGNSLSRSNSVISKEFYLSKRSGELQKIVDEFKFQSKRQNAYYLAKLLSEFLLSNSEFINNREKLVLIPVPTLSNHIRERGLDHTELLVRQLAKNLKIEKLTLIKRISKTTQRGKNFKTRQVQAKNSYEFMGEKLSKDKIYVIFDDIRTTGATLDSIAKILRQSGAKEVWAFYLLQQEK